MRVLVIDDEPDVLLLCRVCLSFDGHEVIEATTGPDALEVAAAERPDVIVLDIMLPELDGLSVLGELKRREETRSIPVIMLTAKVSGRDQMLGWRAGAAFYITKPFSPAALSAAVERVRSMSDSERAAEREQTLRHLTMLGER